MKTYIVICHKCKQQVEDKGQQWTITNISIIEEKRQEKENTYLMCADAVKSFDKLWLKDCLIEMKELDIAPNGIKILYEM